jgi:hypothetical protein
MLSLLPFSPQQLQEILPDRPQSLQAEYLWI